LNGEVILKSKVTVTGNENEEIILRAYLGEKLINLHQTNIQMIFCQSVHLSNAFHQR